MYGLRCQLCDTKVLCHAGDFGYLETHLTDVHKVEDNKTSLILSLSLITTEETDTFITAVDNRWEMFEYTGHVETDGNIFLDPVGVAEIENEKLQNIINSKLDNTNPIENSNGDINANIDVKEELDVIVHDVPSLDSSIDTIDIKQEIVDEPIKQVEDKRPEQVTTFYNKIDVNEKSITSNNLFCRLCWHSSQNETELSDHHLKFHNNDEDKAAAYYMNFSKLTPSDFKFDCNICPVKFLTKNSMTCHKKLKHRIGLDIERTCRVCDTNVKTSAMKNHMKSHNNTTFKCRLCYKTLGDKYTCQAHEKNVHPEEARYLDVEITEDMLTSQCEKCDLKFVTENLLKKHSRTHGDKIDQLSCKLCYKTFSKAKNCALHMRLIHKNDQELFNVEITENMLVYPCDVCPLRFVKQYILKSHMKNQHKPLIPPIPRSKKCKLCYKTFSSASNCTQHMTKCHKNDQEFFNVDITENMLKYSCNACSLRFVKENILKSHIKEQHKKARLAMPGPRKCKLCYVYFKSSSQQQKHIISLHKEDLEFFERDIEESDLKYNCSECSNRYVKESLLVKHNKKHEIKKYSFLKSEAFDAKLGVYRCKFCYSQYKLYGKLIYHIIKHHGQDLHLAREVINEQNCKVACTNCDLKFISEEARQCHLDLFHKNYQTFRCELCPNMFKSFRLLFRHCQNVHKSKPKKRNKCNLCYQSFSLKSSVNAHQRKFHQEEKEFIGMPISDDMLTFHCTKCPRKYVSQRLLLKHLRIHTVKNDAMKESKPVKCKLCYRIYSNTNKLKFHYNNCHRADKAYLTVEITEEMLQFNCDNCQLKFLNDRILKNHMRTHLIFNNIHSTSKCNLCHRNMKSTKELKNHIINVHSKFKDEYEAICAISKGESVPLPYTCSQCNLSFLNNRLLKFHASKCFLHLKSFCILCRIDLKSSSLLGRHIHNIHGNYPEEKAALLRNDETTIEQQFKCKYCEEKMMNIHVLKHHVKYLHSDKFLNNDWTCQFCRFEVKKGKNQKEKKRRHLKLEHNYTLNDNEDYEVTDTANADDEPLKNFNLVMQAMMASAELRDYLT